MDEMGPMGRFTVFGLALYLLAGSAIAAWAIISLWSPGSNAEVVTPNCQNGKTPILSGISPDQVRVRSAQPGLLLLGCGFTIGTTVKLDGVPRQTAKFIDSSHIRVGFTPSDLATVGAVVVTLSDGTTDFGTGVLKVTSTDPADRQWAFFNINQEVQILLLVLFTGAFGSCTYALKSLADFRGDNQLIKPWFTYYVIQPFEGAGVALLLYLAIRGGFLSGTGADVNSVNQFGMCAIAGLAGAFSDTAFLKLKEVFDALFKAKDDRSGKIAGLRITTTKLPDGVNGTEYKIVTLQSVGGKGAVTWSVNPALPADLSLNAKTGEITGKPAAVAKKSKYTFTATDSGTPPAVVSQDLELEIT